MACCSGSIRHSNANEDEAAGDPGNRVERDTHAMEDEINDKFAKGALENNGNRA